MLIHVLCEWLKREESHLDLDIREDPDTGEDRWECAIDHPDAADRLMVFYGSTPAEALDAVCDWVAKRS